MKKICLSILATVVFVLYITTSIHAQEPFKFLGLKFGVAISEQDPTIQFTTPHVIDGTPICEVTKLNDVGIRWNNSLVHIFEGNVASLYLYMKLS